MIGRARLVEGPGQLSSVRERVVNEPGPGELLLKLHATSVNFHDLVGIEGSMENLLLPRVPFSDGVGTVLAVGEGVTGFSEGDRVIPAFFPKWRAGPLDARGRATVLGDQIDGCLQSHLCIAADAVAPAPAHLGHEEAGTLGCAGLTAWRSLVVEGRVQPGQTVVLQGTGGVSLFALGFARMLGARVILLSSSDEKLERGRQLGADVLINYRKHPDWDRQVLEHTNGEGADLVVDVGGGETLARSIRALRIGGHLSVIGVLTGFEANAFPLAEVMLGNLHVVGITVGSVENLRAMCRAIALHEYRPVIDRVFSLEEAHQAVELMRRQGHFGKIAVRLD